MIKIYLDAGHGGNDNGAVYNGRKEKNDNLKMVKAIVKTLQNNKNITVFYRAEDYELPLMQRINYANTKKCDYYLSIHRDAFNNKTANGSSIYVYSKASENTVNLSTKIYNNVIKITGFYKRGIKKGAPNYSDFAVCKYTNMPAALLELGFITNDNDNKIFDEFFNEIAETIANTILEIFNIKNENTTIIHTVKKGENLTGISKKYNTTIEKIINDNKKTYPKITRDFIVTGWKLTINQNRVSEPITHIVKKGENLTAISKKYNTTIEKIINDNKKTYPKITRDFIVTGWKLNIKGA